VMEIGLTGVEFSPMELGLVGEVAMVSTTSSPWVT